MSVYLIPITAAMLIFPFLAALFTIPYIIVQYRRYGSILFFRVLIIYSFIFYLLCAYFLVSLPLPPIEEVQHYTKPIMQLIPFKSLMEFTTSTSLVWNDPATYLTAFNEPSLYLIIFNVLLTVPFGVYLRYYFQYSWKKTLLGSFMLSLSFECLQLSALFGIYPRPYRLFDVDDLITNSFGGMCGYVLTPIFVHFLPTRSKLDEEAFQKGQQVTSMRRVVAFFSDVLFILIASFLLYYVCTKYFTITTFLQTLLVFYGCLVCSVTLLLFILPIFTKGWTFGKALVKIKLVNEEDERPKWYQYFLHFFPLYLFILPIPLMLLMLFDIYFSIPSTYQICILALAVLLCAFYLVSLKTGIHMLFHHNKTAYFERLVKLKNHSMIQVTTKAAVQETKIETANTEEVAEENIENTL